MRHPRVEATCSGGGATDSHARGISDRVEQQRLAIVTLILTSQEAAYRVAHGQLWTSAQRAAVHGEALAMVAAMGPARVSEMLAYAWA